MQGLSLRPHMTPVIDVFIQGTHKRFLIDTGASVSLVQPGTANTPLCQTTLKPQGVTGEALHVLGTQAIEFTIGNRNFAHDFIVSKLPIPADGLSGNEFLSEHEVVMNFQNHELCMEGCKTKFYSLSQPDQRGDSAILNSSQSPVQSQGDSVWYVYTREEFVIPPLSKCVLNGQLEGDSGASSCVCINPLELPIQGLYAAAVVSKVSANTR